MKDHVPARLRAVVRVVGCASAIAAGLLLFTGWIEPTYAKDATRSAPPERAWKVPSNENIRELLAGRMQHNGVGIVVGVIEPEGRRVVAHGKSGASDARPLDGDTVFQIGSVTKVFTTLVLADMVQRGEVKLDDPASKYLPPVVKMPERGRPITLLDLATHMSGLPPMPTNFPLRGEPNPYEAYSVEQLHQFLSSYRLERAPGVKSEYSNLGVALLGRLLGRRAGMAYEALLKQRVLAPLGMSSTAITLTPDQSRRVAAGHDRYLNPVDTWNLTTLPASGSLRSTANDMLIFLAACLGYRDTPLKAAMEYQRAVRQPANGSQALGWGVRNPGGDEIFSHSGGKEGYRSNVLLDLKTRTGIVVLANARTDDQPGDIAMHLLTGKALPPAPRAPEKRKTIALDRKMLEAYAGRYQLTPTRILTVARKDDYLVIDNGGGGISTFLAEGGKDFYLNTGNDQLTFEVDAGGRVTGLVLYGDGRQTGNGQSAPRIDERAH